MLPNCYAGMLLRVNLSDGKIETFFLEAQVAEMFIGGTGIGVKILYDEVQFGVDPIDSENRLIFMTGPFTGSGVPGSGNYSVITRSPLSGFACSAQANGYFGPALKKAGFDGIIIQGAASRLVYLYIHGGKAEIKDASWLAGKDTVATEEALVYTYAEKENQKVRVACIGPAGEHLVRFAGIFNDRGHVAASGGVGAVMGSKNLKAIVVGYDNQSFAVSGSRIELRNLIKKWNNEIKSSGTGQMLDKLGTAGLFSPYYFRGWVPVKNLTTNLFPGHREFEGVAIRQKYQGRRRSCYACPLNHCQRITITDTQGRDYETEEPEYEVLAAWGPNIGSCNVTESILLADLSDRLGVDIKEATFLVSLLMECSEKGVLPEEQLEKMFIKWGDVESVARLLKEIAYRQGIGSNLADGLFSTMKLIGEDAEELAVYVKRGYAPHVHDPRSRWGTIFGQAISDMGSQQGIDLSDRGSPDIGITGPVGFTPREIAHGESRTGPKRQFEDSLGVCLFTCRHPEGLLTLVEALNIMTGWNLNIESALEVGARIINLLRMFNLRHGLTCEDDTVSPRLLEGPSDGPGKGKSLNGCFESTRSSYYHAMGWDDNTGIPLPGTLKKLGLGYTLPKMESGG